MKSISRLLILCAMIAAPDAGAALDAPVNTSRELAVRFLAQAPLALSADGRWRLHVDARRVLHRTRIDGSALPASLGLALRIRAAAIAGDGRRAAVVSDSGCVGVVDFGLAGATSASVRWLADERLSEPGVAWVDTPAPRCLISLEEVTSADQNREAGLGLGVVGLSADGRLLAIRAGVVDVATSRVVARLPESIAIAENPLLMRLQFIDGDRQLLALVESLGMPEGDVGYESHGDLVIAWDLPSGKLRRMAALASFDAPGADPVADGRAHERAAELAHSTAHGEPIAMESTCGAVMTLAARSLLVVGDDIADPRGRWVAHVEWEEVNHFVRRDVGVLVVNRRVDGHEIARFALRRDVRGLVSSPDGTAIYGLTDAAASVAAITDGRARLLEDGVIELSVPVGGLVGGAEPTARLPAHHCGDAEETIDARRVTTADAPLPMLWRRTIVDTFHARLAAFPDIGAWPCNDVGGDNSVFIRRDGSVWLDEFAHSARIDLQTGRTRELLPIARGHDVCAVPLPAADGLFTWQGDTLTLRRFDPRDGARRVVQVRPGWRADEVEVRPGFVMVAWQAKEETLKQFPPVTDGGHGLPVHVAAYADATGRQLGDVFQEDSIGETDSASPPRDPLPVDVPPGDRATCRAPWAPRPGLWRLRIDALDSFRGDTCNDGSTLPRTAFWTGLDLEQSPPGASGLEDYRRELRAVDGSIAVVQSDLHLRVFDLAGRRELGRITLPNVLALRHATVLASQGLVLLETVEDSADGKTSQRWLAAYAFVPPAR